jgi:hypothetical protein
MIYSYVVTAWAETAYRASKLAGEMSHFTAHKNTHTHTPAQIACVTAPAFYDQPVYRTP